MSKQEDFRRSEKPLEKMREIDNEARISKKSKRKRKFTTTLIFYYSYYFLSFIFYIHDHTYSLRKKCPYLE